jgi:hypothetical protein
MGSVSKRDVGNFWQRWEMSSFDGITAGDESETVENDDHRKEPNLISYSAKKPENSVVCILAMLSLEVCKTNTRISCVEGGHRQLNVSISRTRGTICSTEARRTVSSLGYLK